MIRRNLYLFYNFSLGQQYLSDDLKKTNQRSLFKKSKLVWRKNHHEHKYSVTYYKSRNEKTANRSKYIFTAKKFNLKQTFK